MCICVCVCMCMCMCVCVCAHACVRVCMCVNAAEKQKFQARETCHSPCAVSLPSVHTVGE